jgi:hypothetical protein
VGINGGSETIEPFTLSEKYRERMAPIRTRPEVKRPQNRFVIGINWRSQ